MPEEGLKTEQGISDCYWEGVLKHSGSISGFIHVFTQLVKNSQGNGSLILNDADEALSRLLGELSANVAPRVSANHYEMQRVHWLVNESNSETIPPVEEVIAQAAENLADPNFFIAEISGIISALGELKSVAATRRNEKL
jgi:hypothetical protein